LLANGSDNKFQAERDAWSLIHTGIEAKELHPLDPATLSLNLTDYGNGIVSFDELVAWGRWCKRFDFVKQSAPAANCEYVPLFPLLADYWDKPQSELPEALQARVGGRVVKRFVGHKPKFDANGEFERDAEGRYPVWEEVHIEYHESAEGFPLGWDALTPDQRQKLARKIDYQNDPKNAEERTYLWNLVCEKDAIEREIRKWELMHPQSISEAKIQEDKLAELRSKLAEIERRFESPPDTAAPQAAGKGKAGTVTTPTKTKVLAQTWWRAEYEIMTMAQSAGDSLRRKDKRTSNRAIGDAVALEIEQREKAGKKRKGPDGQTIKNADLLGWKYEAE